MRYAILAEHPGYRVREDGVVETCWCFRGFGYRKGCEWYQGERWKPLTPDKDERGRPRLRLRTKAWTYKKKFIAVLVLEAFIGPRPKRQQACHNDGDILNNHLTNLRWDTVVNNRLDKNRHGTMPIGSNHHNSKVTEEAVLDMRIRCEQGETCSSLAKKHGISVAAVSQIILGRTWKHVGGPRQC